MARAIRMTATGDALQTPGCVGSVVLIAGATATAVVELYNGRPVEGGTLVFQLTAPADDSRAVFLGEGKGALFFDKGIFARVSGTAAAAYIYIL